MAQNPLVLDSDPIYHQILALDGDSTGIDARDPSLEQETSNTEPARPAELSLSIRSKIRAPRRITCWPFRKIGIECGAPIPMVSKSVNNYLPLIAYALAVQNFSPH